MKRLLYILLILALCVPAFADRFGNVYHNVQIVDEVGTVVTSITSVTVLNTGSLTGTPTIYKSRNKTNAMTNPITTTSTNTTLDNGIVSWWGPSNWDFSITDGTNIATNANHRDRTSSDGTVVFPSYLTSISTTTYDDSESATFGSTDNVVLQYIAGTAFRLAPSSDGIVLQLGVPSGNQFDTNIYVGGGTGGLAINEGASTFIWNGGTASINNSGTGATNIGVGSSGAISIGDGSAGNVSVDTTGTMTINADDSIDMTTSGAAADIDIDAAAGSLILDGGEAAADAVTVTSAGGIDFFAVDDIDMTLTSGTGGEDFTVALAGSTDSSLILSSTGTGADALSLLTTGGAGDIKVNSTDDLDIDAADDIAVDTADGSMTLTTAGATNGDMTFTVADNLTITVTGDISITGGTTTLDEINFQRNVAENTGSVTLVASQSGGVFTNAGGNSAVGITYSLPTAALGLQFTFIDLGSTAGADVYIVANTADNIDGGTNAKAIYSTSSLGSVTLIAGTITGWSTVAGSGTWTPNNG